MEFVTVWDGTRERQAILAQQRPAEPSIDMRRQVDLSKLSEPSRAVAWCLRSAFRWWSVEDILQATGLPPVKVHSAVLHFHRRGFLEREQDANRDKMRIRQRYRWKG